MPVDPKAVMRLPWVSIQGRIYIDSEALLAYLESLGSPPEPKAKRVKSEDIEDARKIEDAPNAE